MIWLNSVNVRKSSLIAWLIVCQRSASIAWSWPASATTQTIWILTRLIQASKHNYEYKWGTRHLKALFTNHNMTLVSRVLWALQEKLYFNTLGIQKFDITVTIVDTGDTTLAPVSWLWTRPNLLWEPLELLYLEAATINCLYAPALQCQQNTTV